MRGTEDAPREAVKAEKSELDEEFQGPGGQQRWIEYLDSLEPLQSTDEIEETDYEIEMYRVVMHLRRCASIIKQSDFRIWPGETADGPPGTPWSQPAWRSKWLDAFWEGEVQADEEHPKT